MIPKRLTGAIVYDPRDGTLRKENLEAYPEGYPRLAAFINDDDYEYSLFRRFDNLRARCLQAKLLALKALSDKLDQEGSLPEESQTTELHGDGNLPKDPWSIRQSAVYFNIFENTGRKIEERKALLVHQIVALIRHRGPQYPGISDSSCNPKAFRKFWKNCTRRLIPRLFSALQLIFPLSLLGSANAATIPSTSPTMDPVILSNSPSVGEIISAFLVAIVGTVVWHCVKRSPNRRPYLIISLLISAWMYSMVVSNRAGMWPISSLWLYNLVNALVLLRLDMVDLELGLSYGVSVVLAGNFMDGALSSISASTHFLTYLPHAIVLCMIVSGCAIRVIRWLCSPRAGAEIRSWVPASIRPPLVENFAHERENIEAGSAASGSWVAAIEASRNR